MANNNLNFEQLRALTKPQIQQQIRSLGADFHPSESRQDLLGRLLQLQGTAQPIDKIKQQLKEAGIGEDGEVRTDTIPKQSKRLTASEMKKAAAKYVENGMQLLLSKDGQLWEIRFKCEQLRQDGKVVIAKRKDSGNTMIPLSVFKNACELLTTFQKIKRKEDTDEVGEDYQDIADNEEEAA